MTLNDVRLNYNNCMQVTKNFVDNFPWENKNAYANWLTQSYYFVSHSTRLLAMSASRAEFTNKILHKRMLQHILEEIGHEMIAVSDVKQLGDTVNNYPELIETKAFYQSQYYYIQNVSAASFIGYVLFLEGLASTKGFDIFGRVAKVFGESSGKFVKVHAEEDQGHIESAFSLVESLPVSEYENIIQNMNQSTFMYQKMMEEIAFRVAANQTFLNSASASIAV